MLIITRAIEYLKYSLTILMYCLEQFLLFKSDALMDGQYMCCLVLWWAPAAWVNI